MSDKLITPDRHPSQTDLCRFFAFDHLEGHLRTVSERFADLASDLMQDQQLQGAELTTALRKLLEAKDCAVRAAIR